MTPPKDPLQNPEEAPDEEAVLAGATILIVDDEPLNLDLLEQELEQFGCRIMLASDGREALAHLETAMPDAILLDLLMPNLDGYETLKVLKANPAWRHIPIIMVSAVDDIENVIRCIEIGAEDFLPKPFDPVLLKARLDSSLRRKRWRDQERSYQAQIERHLTEIQVQKERADRLLHAILPAPAVAELKAQDRIQPRRHEDVVVLYCDIVGFTDYCRHHPPETVLAHLDQLATAFEDLTQKFGLEKIKTIGDAFMATGGLLMGHHAPVRAAVDCAFALGETAERLPVGWAVRAGLHIGPVVAGIVGKTKFSFDVWGDAVNVAARLSSVRDEDAVYLTRAAGDHVAEHYPLRSLGEITFRGIGPVEVLCCSKPPRSS
ncbi:MAG: adenylate/guanylate cyclase domain-containing protein [Alphaproteobacteria bacterium]|nr:adenylate/guanylate cyclase domain-containing protein [Alphaproteobacteria bacterium]